MLYLPAMANNRSDRPEGCQQLPKLSAGIRLASTLNGPPAYSMLRIGTRSSGAGQRPGDPGRRVRAGLLAHPGYHLVYFDRLCFATQQGGSLGSHPTRVARREVLGGEQWVGLQTACISSSPASGLRWSFG
jgi:hypothetical protein